MPDSPVPPMQTVRISDIKRWTSDIDTLPGRAVYLRPDADSHPPARM